MVKLERN